MTVPEMAGATEAVLEAAIKGDCDFDARTLASDLRDIAIALNGRPSFPTTLDELEDCGIDSVVARQLMQQVYGSTDIVIGLHTRKVVVALDLIDWEDLSAERKRVTLR